MTDPQDGLPPLEIKNAAARFNEWDTAKPRVVVLPAHLREIPPCDGVPDLLSTYCVNGGLALLFTVMLTVGIYMPLTEASFFHGNLIEAVSWFFLLTLVAWMIVIFIRGIRNAGVWFQVDSVGFRYGVRRSPEPSSAMQQTVVWDEIAANPSLRYDVTYIMPSRFSVPSACFEFWKRGARKGLERRTLPKSLFRYDFEREGIRCVRFKNRRAILISVLCGLAHQGLRFDPNVFVMAGIHPETWQRLRQSWKYFIICSLLFLLFGILAFEDMGKISLVFIFTAWFFYFGYFWTEGRYRSSPDMTGYPRNPIVFRIDNADATAEVSISSTQTAD